MSIEKNPLQQRLPPRIATPSTPEQLLAKKQAREQKDAQVRGVTSIDAMRNAIKQASRSLPLITEVPRVGRSDAAGFRALAAQGLPFLMKGQALRWPLCNLPPSILRERYSQVPVRARVGDYINTAFAPDRAMHDLSMRH